MNNKRIDKKKQVKKEIETFYKWVFKEGLILGLYLPFVWSLEYAVFIPYRRVRIFPPKKLSRIRH